MGDNDGNLQRRDALPERITVSCRSIECDAYTLGAGVERDSFVWCEIIADADPSLLLSCQPTTSLSFLRNMQSDDCPKGEFCNSVSPDRCNIIDLLQNANREVVPTPVPSRAPVDAGDPSNTKFVSVIFAHIREGRKKYI